MRLKGWSLIGLMVLLVCSQSTAQKKLDITDIYGEGAKFNGRSLSTVRWVPQQAQFSFYGDDDDVKTLRLFDIQSQQQRKLFDTNEYPFFKTLKRERRRIPDSYYWSPDGKSILINSGADLYLYSVAEERMTHLTTDGIYRRDPTFSPNGKMIAFIKEENLWTLNIASGEEQQLTAEGSKDILIGQMDYVYEEEFHIRTGFFWSPNSEYIAFYRSDESVEPEMAFVNYMPLHNPADIIRYAKPGDRNAIVTVGVVAVKDGKINYIDTGEETDIYLPRVKWLPDSQMLAVYRMNRQQNMLEFLMADIQTGRVKTILTDTEKNGWLDVHDDLQFLKSGKQFIWSSDRSGFRHLYLYDINGKMMRQLTAGDWEIEEVVGVDQEKERIFFTANRESIFEQHLYCVNITGTGFKKLTTEAGTHKIDMNSTCSYYIDAFSDVQTPTKQKLYDGSGRLVTVLEENNIDALQQYRLTVPEIVQITADDGSLLNMAVMKPADFDPREKYPVIFTIYGGPGSQTIHNSWGGSSYLWRQLLTQHDYIVVQLDNRGTGGRGVAFKKQMYRRFGHLEVMDMIGAAQYLQTLPYVDSERIGMWGWSYGGYTTVMNLLKAADYFKVGVAVAPVTDWRNYDSIYTERYMDTPQNNPAGYNDSNALNYAGQLTGKLLLIHGVADDNVHLSHTMQLARKFQQLNIPFDMMIYPRKDHSIRNVRDHLFAKATKYFIDNL